MIKADVYIHSWKAEIASCPWNKSTRLLRITMQLPADQPAATTPNAYPLQVSFDRRQVREFRRLSERHTDAADNRAVRRRVQGADEEQDRHDRKVLE